MHILKDELTKEGKPVHTIQLKDEIQSLLEIESFRSIIQFNSYPEISSIIRNSGEFYDQYCTRSDSEELPDGVVLFSTPQVSDDNDTHSYLQVIKLYGDRDLPFRVIGVRIWDEHDGVSMPVLSDMRTLAEALDYAFAGHDLDTFNHEEIQRHLLERDASSSPAQIPMLRVLQAQVDADRTEMKALDARLAAPIKKAEIATVMALAKAKGLALDELPNVDYAVQMNQALFAGKGEIHVLYTATADNSGSHGDVAVVSIKDASGKAAFYDMDGKAKTWQQVMDSYIKQADDRLHRESPDLKQDGLGILDFTEVLSKKLDSAEMNNEVNQELYIRGEQYSRSRSLIYGALTEFTKQREANYQSSLAKNKTTSFEL